MIKVLESICEAPIRFLPDKTAKLEVGLIGQIIEIDGVPCCTVSDGTRPFGVIAEINCKYGLVSMWFETMILCTDKFEKRGENYLPGTSLYVSKRGKLSTRKINENSQLVGHVISGPSDKHGYLELNWT